MNIFTKLFSIILFSLLASPPMFADSHADLIKVAVNNPAHSDADRKRDETSKPVAILNFLMSNLA